jgi:hypothetical protein
VIDRDKPRRVFIDAGGVGVRDRLRETGYGDIVRPIDFSSAPSRAQRSAVGRQAQIR